MQNQQIEKIQKNLDQLAAQKEALLARDKQRDRKVRTHRLCVVGGTLETIGITTGYQASRVLKVFKKYPELLNYVLKEKTSAIKTED